METLPQPQSAEQQDILLGKAKRLIKLVRELARTNAKLQNQLGTQHAELVELRKRLRQQDRVRQEAKRRLRHLANQLPGK